MSGNKKLVRKIVSQNNPVDVRFGVVVSTQAGPPRTVTATVSEVNVPSITIMDHIYEYAVGDGIWIVSMGAGRLLGLGTVGSVPRAAKAEVEASSYIPSLVNLNLGTTGTKSADYMFIGGPNVGDRGHLDISAVLILGGTGFSITANPQIILPPGFESIPLLQNGLAPVGQWAATNTGIQTYKDSVFAGSAGDNLVLLVEAVSGSAVITTSTTNSAPFGWGTGDSFTVSASFPAIRV